MERSNDTRYTVTIDTAAKAPLELAVSADGWVEAWQEGLRALGIEAFPADAVCSVQGEVVRIRAPSIATTFLIEPSGSAAEKPPRNQPIPAAQAPTPQRSARRTTPISRMKPVTGPVDGERPPRRLSPGPAPSLRLDSELNTTAPARPAVMSSPPASETSRDPLDALLDLLARQRHQSNPVKISEDTGLPTPVTRPITRVLRPVEPRDPLATVEADRPNGEDIPLPQQFHPVVADAEQVLETPPRDPLGWAIDTAWQHIPCAIAIAVSHKEGHLEVLAVRCGQDRPWHAATFELPQSWYGFVARAPGRTRYQSPIELELVLDEGIETFSVSSVIGTPVVHTSPTALLLLNSPRISGFTDAEVRALAYLGRTLEAHLRG
jgi:hypothetical protein